MTNIHVAIRATQHVPAVINAKRHLDAMTAIKVKAEQQFLEASRLFREAGTLADAASDAFFNTVAEHYDPASGAC